MTAIATSSISYPYSCTCWWNDHSNLSKVLAHPDHSHNLTVHRGDPPDATAAADTFDATSNHTDSSILDRSSLPDPLSYYSSSSPLVSSCSTPYSLDSTFSHLADLADLQIVSINSPLCSSPRITTPTRRSSSPCTEAEDFSKPSGSLNVAVRFLALHLISCVIVRVWFPFGEAAGGDVHHPCDQQLTYLGTEVGCHAATGVMHISSRT